MTDIAVTEGALAEERAISHEGLKTKIIVVAQGVM